jgi:hypothetical protein
MRFELLSVLDMLPMGKAAQPKAVVSSKKDLE